MVAVNADGIVGTSNTDQASVFVDVGETAEAWAIAGLLIGETDVVVKGVMRPKDTGNGVESGHRGKEADASSRGSRMCEGTSTGR